MPKTAAALIIGNEILTGKIQEENVAFLARELFGLGVVLRRVVVCPDEMDVIVRDLDALRAEHDVVITSGGVGPTHDDITIDAVARAFGRSVVRSAEVESLIRGHYGDRVTAGHLRMANMPEGAQLIRNAELPWPTIHIGNVYVLPGVPAIFRRKFEAIRPHLRGEIPFVSRAVYTLCDEGEVAALLQRLAVEHPEVTIGSYPRFRDPEYRVKITFDARDATAVQAAADALVDALDPEKVVRVS
ncbi:MAG: competence/damage-inducible protein A [Myxococcota bacterium]